MTTEPASAAELFAHNGGGLRHAVGELVTCTRCVGAWSALGVVGLRLAYPDAGRNVANVLAVTGRTTGYRPAFGRCAIALTEDLKHLHLNGGAGRGRVGVLLSHVPAVSVNPGWSRLYNDRAFGVGCTH